MPAGQSSSTQGAAERSITPTGALFLDELGRHRPEPPRPLPARFEPIARLIVGDHRIRVARSVASRRALARVGKRAATTGDVIHVRDAHTGPDVIAHELTHVAHPSPMPRFFADDHAGPEERAADRAAEMIRRSPILARTTAASASPRRPVAPAVAIGASRRPEPVAAGASGGAAATGRGGHATAPTITAADLAAGSGGTVRRRALAPVASSSSDSASAPGASGSTASTTHRESTHPDAPAAAREGGQQRAATTTDILSQFDGILELLEERILTELERRGGRFRGGF